MNAWTVTARMCDQLAEMRAAGNDARVVPQGTSQESGYRFHMVDGRDAGVFEFSCAAAVAAAHAAWKAA